MRTLRPTEGSAWVLVLPAVRLMRLDPIGLNAKLMLLVLPGLDSTLAMELTHQGLCSARRTPAVDELHQNH